MQKLTRRKFLEKSSIGVASLATLSSPAIPRRVWASEPVKLRVLGTHVTLQEPIRQRAMRDLNIDIEFTPGGSAYVLQKAATRPQSFDLYEQWSDSIRVLWEANAIQPIETERIENWAEVNSLAKQGRLSAGDRIGRGDAPHRILNVQEDDTLGEKATGLVSYLPYVHNVDSFGYNTDVIPEGEPYVTESWGWLLDPEWHGKVGVVNAPTIGIFDLALAAEARGLMKFHDLGNMTHKEMDDLFEIVIDLKQHGHFGGVWNSVPDSVALMKSGRVCIESMFSPAVGRLNAQSVPVTYAAPREGYRGWHGVMCLSSETTGEVRDAAYRFMNWWLSGWAGAFIARQGYYISVPERAREFLSGAEWDYWYDGKEAIRELDGTDGKVAVTAGAIRTGGSYQRRFQNVAVWNTVMDTYEHSLSRWYDFLSA